MDGGPGRIEIFPNHFEAPTSSDKFTSTRDSTISHLKAESSLRSHHPIWAGGRVMKARSMLKLFSLPGLHRASSIGGNDKVELTAAEVESLRSEIADAEEREAHVKARLEHVDEILRSAHLAGYLYIRTRWTELPGEPPILDDVEVDDWIPRFVVLNDLGPLDSTLLSDISEVGLLPSIVREDQETRYAFYILTCHGLRFECSSHSKVQASRNHIDCVEYALRGDGMPISPAMDALECHVSPTKGRLFAGGASFHLLSSPLLHGNTVVLSDSGLVRDMSLSSFETEKAYIYRIWQRFFEGNPPPSDVDCE